ncbi:helix-turn-helix domain-containing protein [Anoxybacillus flavithermus]|uniref:helix-turn-helix domain-containing protein n=1 Tax=Anoxybacillus flavithermus TaxID=33934 RepID=UPI0009BD3CAD|nr:helix-turn-helix domain-containing protein [Anoxybacillus flavithermus]
MYKSGKRCPYRRQEGADEHVEKTKNLLEAVQRALAGESVKVIAHHLEITDPDYIYKWIDQYEMYGEVGLKRKVRNHPEMDKDFIIRELEMENEILKKYLQILEREGRQRSSK